MADYFCKPVGTNDQHNQSPSMNKPIYNNIVGCFHRSTETGKDSLKVSYTSAMESLRESVSAMSNNSNTKPSPVSYSPQSETLCSDTQQNDKSNNSVAPSSRYTVKTCQPDTTTCTLVNDGTGVHLTEKKSKGDQEDVLDTGSETDSCSERSPARPSNKSNCNDSSESSHPIRRNSPVHNIGVNCEMKNVTILKRPKIPSVDMSTPCNNTADPKPVYNNTANTMAQCSSVPKTLNNNTPTTKAPSSKAVERSSNVYHHKSASYNACDAKTSSNKITDLRASQRNTTDTKANAPISSTADVNAHKQNTTNVKAKVSSNNTSGIKAQRNNTADATVLTNKRTGAKSSSNSPTCIKAQRNNTVNTTAPTNRTDGTKAKRSVAGYETRPSGISGNAAVVPLCKADDKKSKRYSVTRKHYKCDIKVSHSNASDAEITGSTPPYSDTKDATVTAASSSDSPSAPSKSHETETKDITVTDASSPESPSVPSKPHETETKDTTVTDTSSSESRSTPSKPNETETKDTTVTAASSSESRSTPSKPNETETKETSVTAATSSESRGTPSKPHKTETKDTTVTAASSSESHSAPSKPLKTETKDTTVTAASSSESHSVPSKPHETKFKDYYTKSTSGSHGTRNKPKARWFYNSNYNAHNDSMDQKCKPNSCDAPPYRASTRLCRTNHDRQGNISMTVDDRQVRQKSGLTTTHMNGSCRPTSRDDVCQGDDSRHRMETRTGRQYMSYTSTFKLKQNSSTKTERNFQREERNCGYRSAYQTDMDKHRTERRIQSREGKIAYQ